MMTKSQLIAQIQARCPDLGRRTVEDAVSLFFKEIATGLQRGHRIELRGFGSFCIRQRNERIARNPRSGDVVCIPSKNVPFFKAGKAFKALLNQENPSLELQVACKARVGSIALKTDGALPLS